MLKKAGILFCLLAFTFQALLFNAFLYGVILSAKIDEGGYTKQITLLHDQYKNLNWLNKTEFLFGNYLFDVKEIKNGKDEIVLLCKVDLKEKNFLEKLADDIKHSKNKKTATFSFVYKVSEPYQLNFITESKKMCYPKIIISIAEIVKDKSSPPPKA